MPILVVGVSHRRTPVEIREKLAFPASDIPVCLAELRNSKLADEAVIVSTCNRVELYAACPGLSAESLPALRHFFLAARHCAEMPADGLYVYDEPQSLEHLFRVVSGLDSMVIGETEILGQVKQAYDLALKHQLTGKALNRAFQRAFNVAKQIRTETQIQRGSVSVASVAVDLAEKIFSSLKDRQVLIIGAGDTGEKTARALLSRGAAHLTVTNRSPERAQALAAELGGTTAPFDSWHAELARVDIVIASTGSPTYLLRPKEVEEVVEQREHRPLLLIDISVPRNIDPEVNAVDDAFLYNVDDLQGLADDAMRQRREEVAHCEAIIREKAKALLNHGPPGAANPSQLAYGS